MISVIMPVYNAAGFLPETIRSLQEQSCGDFELIAVDDGSTDESAEIISKYASSDPRIRLVRQENGGPSKARNTGIAHAGGEWLYFMDSDDQLHPDAFKELAAAGEGFDLVIFGRVRDVFDDAGRLIKRDTLALPDKDIRSADEMKLFLREVARDSRRDVFFSYIWNRMIRTQLVRENALEFDEDLRLGEDFVFNTKAFKCSAKVRIVQSPYYRYMVRGTDTLVGKFYPNELERRKRMYAAMTGLYEHYGEYEECREILEINEGKTSLMCMKKIDFPTCRLGRKEKIGYIKGFLKDERRRYMVSYLRSRPSKRNIARSVVLGTGQALPVYLTGVYG